MTEFIDYLIRKQLGPKAGKVQFKTKASSIHLKLIPQRFCFKKHLKLINLKPKQLTGFKLPETYQNNQIHTFRQPNYDCTTNEFSHQSNPKPSKNTPKPKDKYILHFSPELNSLATEIQKLQVSQPEFQNFTKTQNHSKLPFKQLGKLNQSLQTLRKISPFQKDLKKTPQSSLKSKKILPQDLQYTIQTIYSIPLIKHNDFHLKNDDNSSQNNPGRKKNGSQNQIQSENIHRAYLYLTTQKNDVKFCVRCYFADQSHRRIRIKDQYVRNQFIYEQFGVNHILDHRENVTPSNHKLRKMNPQVNPITGEIFLEFTFLSISQETKLTELLDDCENYLLGKLNEISQLISRIQNLQHSDSSSFEIFKKKQGILDECKLLLKANLFQSDQWISKNLAKWKEVEKQIENQILMAYTFPNKVPQYEIMQDPFLKQNQKISAIKKLRQNEQSKKSIQWQKEIQKQGKVDFAMISPKSYESSKNMSGIFLGFKKSLQQVKTEIERCKQNCDSKDRCMQMRIEAENRKRCQSLIEPISSNKIKLDAIEKINLEQSFNKDMITCEFNKLKENKALSEGHKYSQYQNVLRLRTTAQEKFCHLRLIKIEDLESLMQVEKIIRKEVPNKANLHKPLSLGYYLFDYKNLDAYSKWLVEQKNQKTELVNSFLQSKYSFPSKEFFASSKEFTEVYNQSLTNFQAEYRNIPNAFSLPNMEVSSNLSLKMDESSFVEVLQKQKDSKVQPFSISPMKNLHLSNIPSFTYLDWDKKCTGSVSKINQKELPESLVFQKSYIFSIRVAARAIGLKQFLQRNRSSLRFGKKVYIYKQIIEFYYILEYSGINKDIRFGFEDICICKNLNVKIDCKLNQETSKKPKLPKMHSILLSIFLHIFLDGEYTQNSILFQKPCQNDNSFSDLNHTPKKNSKYQNQDFMNEFSPHIDSDQKCPKSDLNQQNENKDKNYEKFSEFRYLRNHGDVTFLKIFFTLLKRYDEVQDAQNKQFFKGQPTSTWLFALIRKLHDYLEI